MITIYNLLRLTLIWLRTKVSLQLIRQTTRLRFSIKCSFILHKSLRGQQIINKSTSGKEVLFHTCVLASCVSADVLVSNKRWGVGRWCIYRRLRRNLWRHDATATHQIGTPHPKEADDLQILSLYRTHAIISPALDLKPLLIINRGFFWRISLFST